MYKIFNTDPRPWAVLFSMALSLILGWNALVNTDGILYLNSAASFQSGDFQKAFAIYPWAFYASLIALLAKITPLNLEHAAVVLDAALYGVMIAGFITVVKKMGGDKLTLWFAFLTMIVSPALNDYREYIIRDFGQWAFLPWAIYFYMCCYEKVTVTAALGWTLTIIHAFLFRIEAVLVIAFAPALLLVLQTHQPLRVRAFNAFKLYSVFGVLAIMGLGILISQEKLDMLGRFGTLQDTLRFMVVDTGALYLKHTHAIAAQLSVSLKPEHAAVILTSGLLFYLLYTVIKLLTLVFVPFIIATLYKGYVPAPQLNRCVWMFIGIYTLAVIQHMSQHYFLSSRYVMPIAICFMLWVPFALTKAMSLSLRWRALIALLFVYLFISGVTHFGYSKAYLRDAGTWLASHAPEHARVISNSNHALYYSDHAVDWSKDYVSDDYFLSVKDIKPGDYLVVAYHRKDDALLRWIASHQTDVVSQYQNKRGDGIVVIVSP